MARGLGILSASAVADGKNLCPTENNPNELNASIWFQKNNAPPFDINVRTSFHNTFPQRWTGREGKEICYSFPSYTVNLFSVRLFEMKTLFGKTSTF